MTIHSWPGADLLRPRAFTGTDQDAAAVAAGGRGKSKGGYLFLPRRLSRGAFLKWLRRIHAWCGLWGAALGLMFGFTGILMNHRALLPIPAAKWTKSTIELRLPAPPPASPEALGRWLQGAMDVRQAPKRIQQEPSRPVPWGDGALTQPERWQVSFASPGRFLDAEYFVGNGSVTVTRREGNVFGLLTSLHTAVGAGVGWILLADTVAGSVILLALTGVLLWTRLHGTRLLAAGLALSSIGFAVWLAAWPM